MLKVLLADDERIILRGLRKLVHWESHGMQIIGEVYNGLELLQAIEQLKPDIVISDIVMPGLTGTEVLKQIRDWRLPTAVIFMSAFRDFSYAQEALAYGAIDYLVKPVDPERLEECVVKAGKLVRQTLLSESNLSRLTELERQKTIMQEREWLARLLDGDRTGGTIQAFAKSTELDAQTRFFIICAEKEDILNHQAAWDETEWKLLQFAMQNIFEDTINEYGIGWCVVVREKICAVVVEGTNVNVEGMTNRLQERLRAFLKVQITLGLSKAETLEKLCDAFECAATASQYRYFVTDLPYISETELPAPPDPEGLSTDPLKKMLIETLIASAPQQMDKLYQQWQMAASREAWGNRDHLIYLAYGLLLVMTQAAVELGLESDIRDEKELMQRLISFDNAHSLVLFVGEELRTLASLRHVRTDTKEAALLTSIKDYISQHYGADLNLDAMALRFFMNASYFSTFFKKHTGKNFKSYVTELRMKEAHRLLLNTNMMIYEISETVGYNNARQFSDMFKKHYGRLPNDYRQEEGNQP